MDEGEDNSDGAISYYDRWSEASGAGVVGRDGPLRLHQKDLEDAREIPRNSQAKGWANPLLMSK